jgi:hypothetical protein
MINGTGKQAIKNRVTPVTIYFAGIGRETACKPVRPAKLKVRRTEAGEILGAWSRAETER